MFQNFDLHRIFAVDVPLLEIVLRGTLIYLGIFLMLRVVLRREAGEVGTTDFLMVVLIADAAQNGMAAQYQSVTVGLILVLTLIFWNFVLDFLSYKWPWFERWVQPRPVLLVDHGKVCKRGLKSEMLSRAELYSMLREKGIDKIAKVKRAFMEGNGEFTVIKKE